MTTKSDIDVAIEVILDKAAADARIAARARIVAQLASATAKPAEFKPTQGLVSAGMGLMAVLARFKGELR